jgi:uncharacterized SAM-binding protein YcdF (DUF218 family)
MGSRKTKKRSWELWAIALLLPIVWVGQYQVKATLRQPQAILVLGGSLDREHFAATFAQEHPELEVWVSSGSNREYAEWVFQEADISRDRLHLDYQAVDTVTNFTTLVDDLKAANIKSVYLITSDYHMRRAVIIGQVVLGSRDISFQPVIVPSPNTEPEPLLTGLRDGARAVLWILTGRTGSAWGQAMSKS